MYYNWESLRLRGTLVSWLSWLLWLLQCFNNPLGGRKTSWGTLKDLTLVCSGKGTLEMSHDRWTNLFCILTPTLSLLCTLHQFSFRLKKSFSEVSDTWKIDRFLIFVYYSWKFYDFLFWHGFSFKLKISHLVRCGLLLYYTLEMIYEPIYDCYYIVFVTFSLSFFHVYVLFYTII